MSNRFSIGACVVLFSIAAFVPKAGAVVVHDNVNTSVKLQNALQVAESNGDDDVIHLTAGVFSVVPIGNNPFFYQADPAENHKLTIIGADASTTILDGNLTQQIMRLDTSAVVGDSAADISISGVTFFHGSEGGSGGGLQILTTDADVAVSDCFFTANEVTSNAAPQLDGSGGGASVYIDGSGDIAVSDSFFQGNQADETGGSLAAQSLNGNVTLANSVFRNGQAKNGGGGVALISLGGELSMSNNVLQDNVSTSGGPGGGGAILFSVSSLHVVNNVFFNNLGGIGGGAAIFAPIADLYNNIFFANDSLGGADDILALNPDQTTFSVFNNIFYEMCFDNPDACDVSALGEDQGANLIGADPLFVDAGAGDFHLSAGSPAINAGRVDAPGLPETDFEGDARVIGPTPDMGADEVAGACGNGSVETGEECDQGADNSDTAADACRTICLNPSCGDGVTDSGETCDDGNTDDGDGCSASCQEETTGEGTAGTSTAGTGTAGTSGDGGGGCSLIRN